MFTTFKTRLIHRFNYEKEMIKQEQAQTSKQFTFFEINLCITISLALCCMNFLADPRIFILLWSGIFKVSQSYWELAYLCHWIFASVLGYMLVPYLFLRYYRLSLSTYYWDFKVFLKHLHIYLGLMIPVLGLVYWVSHWSSFQELYPFYKLAHRSWYDFFIWECAYALQFLALEFFFRAFILQSFRPSLGYAAIPIMIIPYCMIHFQKTAAESLASIVAGLILGWLAMRSRSIWGGIFIHWLIALAMDIMSLIQTNQWPPGS
jgi:uncharacterized protein